MIAGACELGGEAVQRELRGKLVPSNFMLTERPSERGGHCRRQRGVAGQRLQKLCSCVPAERSRIARARHMFSCTVAYLLLPPAAPVFRM